MYITTYTARKGHEYYEYIPTAVSDALKKADKNELRKICEIRLKNEDDVSVTSDCVRFFNADGTFSDSPKNAIHISSGVLLNTLERMCQSSVYAAQSELRNGFLTLPGGHRVGVCGKVNVENGKIMSLTELSGLNFRIAGDVQGAVYKRGRQAFKHTRYISAGMRKNNSAARYCKAARGRYAHASGYSGRTRRNCGYAGRQSSV